MKLSTIHYPLSTMHYPLSTMHYPLSTIYKSFIWSNIPIALDAAAWTGLTYKALNSPPDYLIVFMSFGFTWLFYTKDRMDFSPADTINNPKRTAWYAHQRYLKPLMWCVAALLFVCLSQRLAIFVPVLVGIVPCLLYTKQWVVRGQYYSLKALSGVKTLLVAFLWVVLTVHFPVVYLGVETAERSVITQLCLMIGCFVMLQINTNDLRDIEGDTVENIKSFAVLWGDKKARLLCFVLIGLGIYSGWAVFNHTALLAFGLFLFARTLLYKKEADVYWQTAVSLQGVLAYWVL